MGSYFAYLQPQVFFRLFSDWLRLRQSYSNAQVQECVQVDVGGKPAVLCTSSLTCHSAGSLQSTEEGALLIAQTKAIVPRGRRLLTCSASCLSVVINPNTQNNLGENWAAGNAVQSSEVPSKENKHCRTLLGNYLSIWGSSSILEVYFSSPYRVRISLCWVRSGACLGFMSL